MYAATLWITIWLCLYTTADGTTNTDFQTNQFGSRPSGKPWICEHICTCTYDNLTHLYAGNCSARHLTDIPQNISADFIHLDFSHNDISAMPDDIFSGFGLLRTLDLSSNKLENLTSNAFSGLHSLHALYLNNNTLALRLDQPPFSPNLFSDLKNLETLHMNNNSQTCAESCGYPDEALSQLNELQTLFIDGLPNQPFGKGFLNLTKLQTLRLGNDEGFCWMPILHKDTFSNLKSTNLTNLSILHCDIETIHPEAFRPLKKIQYLDLTWHHLNFSSLKTGLTGLSLSPIKVLKLVHIQHPGSQFTLPENTFESLRETNLTDLIFQSNGVSKIGDSFIHYLPKSLQNLDLSQNYMVVGTQDWLFFIPLLVNLVSFNGSNQASGMATNTKVSHSAFPMGYQHQQYPMSNVRHMDQSQTSVPSDVTDVTNVSAPVNLRYIYMQNDGLHLHSIPALRFSENNLMYADFSGNFMKFKGPMYGLHKLEYFDISNAKSDILSLDFFDDMPSLEKLLLHENSLNCLSKDKEGKTFTGIDNLRYIDLSNNDIEQLHPPIFKQQYHLETLLLRGNYLTSWQVKVGHMTNLSYLDLSKNRLTTLDSSTRQELDKLIGTATLNINLSQNQLQCSCNNIEFLKWIKDRHEFFRDVRMYSCVLPDNRNVTFADLPGLIKQVEYQCASNTILIAGSVAGPVLFLCILLSAVVYRHRWQVRFYKNRLALRLRLYEPLIEDHEVHISYDAFLSYEDSQHQFIINRVYRILEEQQGFKLCIHTRDFIPGTAIAVNIYRAVHYSNRTVTFITEEYLKSAWCIYELKMAYLESVHVGREILIPVLMEPVDFTNQPRDIQKIFKCLTYLDFNTMDEDQFFNRLSSCLRTAAE